MKLPPLPGSYWPVGFQIQLNEDAFCKMQLLSYGESCARMAREEAAKIAEETIVAEFEGVDYYGDKAAAAIRKG